VFWSIFVLVTALALVLAWVTLLHRQVNKQTQALRSEIEERKRMELQVAATHKELLIASRGAGMAEVATSVLHNVGNVLNSVNVSANLVVETTKDPTHTAMARVSQLIQEHADDLPVFLTQDPKGQQLPKYLELQAERHLAVQQTVRDELESLTRNINHIKEIVARQQSYAMRIGVTEVLQVAELIEDALHMNTGALTRHNVTVVRDFAPNLPSISVDKHNVLQILVNLISNAKCACHESNRPDKRLTVRTLRHGDRVRISVTDNGVGITPENMSRIFNFGFTTREGGHGYGLHSGALAARTLGGTLEVQSEGSGQGATFVLELPLQSA
jgi:signal transduction histidine kinase